MKNHYLHKGILSFFMVVSFMSASLAQDKNALFEQANKYAENKNYDEAVKTYLTILKSATESAEVEFNLANTYYAQNKIGEAILHYERAARIAPRDKDIQQNLRLANETIENKIAIKSGFFITAFWNNLKMSASSNIWSFLALLLFWLGIAGFTIWQIGKDRTRRKQGFFAGIFLVVISVFPFLLAQGKAKIELKSAEGIIMTSETNLHAASENNSPVINVLEEGIKVDLLDNINNWYKVRLANGEEGWLPEQAFEEI